MNEKYLTQYCLADKSIITYLLHWAEDDILFKDIQYAYWAAIINIGKCKKKDLESYKDEYENFVLEKVNEFIDSDESKFKLFYYLNDKFGKYSLALLGKCLINLEKDYQFKNVMLYIYKYNNDMKIELTYSKNKDSKENLIITSFIKSNILDKYIMNEDYEIINNKNYSLNYFEGFLPEDE